MRVCILCFYAHPHKSPALLNLHLICADTVGCYHLYYVYAGGESADCFGWGGFCLVSHYMTGEVADYDAVLCTARATYLSAAPRDVRRT